jgi:hypothetical protein
VNVSTHYHCHKERRREEERKREIWETSNKFLSLSSHQ